MPKTLVLQSAAPDRPEWINNCLASVERWVEAHDMTRLLLGDEFFDVVPLVWRKQAGREKLPVTDFARLLWMRNFHQEGFHRVIWVDADVLVLDQQMQARGGDLFCYEVWIVRDPDGHLAFRPSINNCFMAFEAQSPLLDWYLRTCESAEGPLDRVALGPVLLETRAKSGPLPCHLSIPTFNPLLVEAFLEDDEEILRFFRDKWPYPIEGVHLTSSIALHGRMEEAIKKMEFGQ
jgi:hypothetical protein